MSMMINNLESFDEKFARELQEEYDSEAATKLQVQDRKEENETVFAGNHFKTKRNSLQIQTDTGLDFLASDVSPVDSSLEYSDPNPDIRVLFLQFNTQFFWGKLSGIEVKWSPRMTLCAGLCVYEGHGGLCSVRLSLPLLKLRPRKDLVETLLHEMIHAYLFVTNNDRDHDGHGPQFQGHMHRINKATGANISIYHTFHDEVESYQQHWWRCNGPCQNRRPYFGYVKRAMNRAPSPRDFWWAEHQATCGGTYSKIKEPEGFGQKKGGKKEPEDKSKMKDIRTFGGKGHVLGSTTSKTSSTFKSKDSSNIGTSRNPATIFNVNNNNMINKALNLSGSSMSSSKNTQPSVIVNGILQKKKGDKSSSLFSEIQSTKALSTANNNSTLSNHEKSQPCINGSSSDKPNNSSTTAGLDDDDDDLWMTDINNIESVPLSSFMKNKGVKIKAASTNSENSSTSSLSKINNKDAFKDNRRKSGFSFKSKNRRNKPSVCKGGVFYKDKMMRKKKKYILDELDSNDNLWEIPCGSSNVKKDLKTELNVSPLKFQLKEECNIKDECYVPKFDSSNIKSENHKGIDSYFPSSSQKYKGSNGDACHIPEKSRIKEETKESLHSNEHSLGFGNCKKLSNEDFGHEIVNLSDFDDDEFDFVPSKISLLNNKISKQKQSKKASPSQRSIGSFFTPSGSTKGKSHISNTRINIFESMLSPSQSGHKYKSDVNDELPDISNEEIQKKSIKSSSVRNITNYFPTPASASTSTGLKRGSHQSSSDEQVSKNSQRRSMVVDDYSDSADDEDFSKASFHNKKRSSNEAFEHDRNSTSDNDNDFCKIKDDCDSYALPSKRVKYLESPVSSSGSSTCVTNNQNNENSEDDDNDMSGKVNCPVCNIVIAQADINSHLDICLQ